MRVTTCVSCCKSAGELATVLLHAALLRQLLHLWRHLAHRLQLHARMFGRSSHQFQRLTRIQLRGRRCGVQQRCDDTMHLLWQKPPTQMSSHVAFAKTIQNMRCTGVPMCILSTVFFSMSNSAHDMSPAH